MDMKYSDILARDHTLTIQKVGRGTFMIDALKARSDASTSKVMAEKLRSYS
jgi:hypothetical protein